MRAKHYQSYMMTIGGTIVIIRRNLSQNSVSDKPGAIQSALMLFLIHICLFIEVSGF